MIIFRADGNAKVGSGHVMRCLSIADAARQAGEECVFVTASDYFQPVIMKRGYTNYVLHTDYRDMESEDFLPAFNLCAPSVLFVDSYFATVKYLVKMKERCQKIGIKLVYIDDMFMFPYPCDMVLNYNIYAREDDYRELYTGQSMPQLLLGTVYTPLRMEFQNLPVRRIEQEVNGIFVSTGGADPEHMAVELVRQARFRNYTFHFVMGTLNGDKEKLYKLSEGYENIIIHENVTSMSSLMQSCDVAISAAGSTLYELCATQTPTVTYVLADNQKPGAEEFSSYGLMKNCGDVRELGNRELAKRLVDSAIDLANDCEERSRIARKMRIVVDGRGAERICMEI